MSRSFTRATARLLTVAALAALPVLGAASAHADQYSSGRNSILGGNQVFAPISAPINVCGVAVGLLGDASASCEGGATVTGR